MQQYAQAAKELLDNVAKLTIRQHGAPRPPAPMILQASSSAEAPRPYVPIELRVSQFKQELLASRINLDDLRRLAYQGIPDRDGLRAMTWKVRAVVTADAVILSHERMSNPCSKTASQHHLSFATITVPGARPAIDTINALWLRYRQAPTAWPCKLRRAML